MIKKKFGVYAIMFKNEISGVFISRDIENAKLKFEAEIYHDPKPENFQLRCLGMYSNEQKRIIPTNIFIMSGQIIKEKTKVIDFDEIIKTKNIAKENEERKLKQEEIIVRLFDGVIINENKS